MRIDDAGRSEKSGIGNAPDPGISIVVGHILEKPIDGVVKVAAIVDVLIRLLVVDVRTHLDELAFRHVSPADVLKNKDVSRLVEIGRGPELRAVQVDAVRPDAVRRAIDQKRVRV